MADSDWIIIACASVLVINTLLFFKHFISNRSLKKRLGIPLHYILLSQDLTPSKNGSYWYKNIIGKPDLVFAKPIAGIYFLPIYRKILIIDIKSRDGISPTLYERYQMNLYYLLVSKNVYSMRYETAIMYVNHYERIKPSPRIIRFLLHKKQELRKAESQM